MKAAPSPEAAHKMMVDAYIKMRDALRSTGRPIAYSLCQYGNDAVWRWGAEVGGNLWRTMGDISDKYSSMAQSHLHSVIEPLQIAHMCLQSNSIDTHRLYRIVSTGRLENQHAPQEKTLGAETIWGPTISSSYGAISAVFRFP